MKQKCFGIAASLLLSLNVLAADGAFPPSTLATPALWAKAPTMFTCSLTNVSSTEHTVRMRIIGGNGVTLKDSQSMSLPAKNTKGLEIEGSSEGSYMYCEFDVDGRKTWYRGVAKMYHVTGEDFMAVPAN